MNSNFKRLMTFRQRLAWIGIGLMLLSGCGNTPRFVNSPPASYRVPLPAEFQGIWEREGKDYSEQVRVLRQEDGSARFEFFKTLPADKPVPVEAVMAQTMRFDNADWLLLDLRELIALHGSQNAVQAPFELVKYVIESPDRLCGIAASATLFGEAIQAGQLEGTVETFLMPLPRVTVTSSGADWVKWWSALPESRKRFSAPLFCFKRVKGT